MYAGNEIGWTVRGILNTVGEFDIACLPFPDSSFSLLPLFLSGFRKEERGRVIIS